MFSLIEIMAKKGLGNWYGVLGFVLGIIFFIVFFSFYDVCHFYSLIRTLPVLVIIEALALIFCIMGLKRDVNKISRVFVIIGLVIAIFGAFNLLFFIVAGPTAICDDFSRLDCLYIELNITKINASDNTITIAREDDYSESIVKYIKVRINNETAGIIFPEENQRWLNNSETKTYTLDKNIKQGDLIMVGAVIDSYGEEIVCPFSQGVVIE